jgi:hypothetical protein
MTMLLWSPYSDYVTRLDSRGISVVFSTSKNIFSLLKIFQSCLETHPLFTHVISREFPLSRMKWPGRYASY